MLPAIASITVTNAKVTISSLPSRCQCLRRRRRVNHTLRQIHNEENYNIPKVPLPVLSIFVFRLAGASFVYVPVPVVVLSGTASLESRNGCPVSDFDFLRHSGDSLTFI